METENEVGEMIRGRGVKEWVGKYRMGMADFNIRQKVGRVGGGKGGVRRKN